MLSCAYAWLGSWALLFARWFTPASDPCPSMQRGRWTHRHGQRQHLWPHKGGHAAQGPNLHRWRVAACGTAGPVWPPRTAGPVRYCHGQLPPLLAMVLLPVAAPLRAGGAQPNGAQLHLRVGQGRSAGHLGGALVRGRAGCRRLLPLCLGAAVTCDPHMTSLFSDRPARCTPQPRQYP